MAEDSFKAGIVHLILQGQGEQALKQLSQKYGVTIPQLRVGMPKGESKFPGCYVVERRTVYVSHADAMRHPQIILHEFYHHLRSQTGKHRGTEKNADIFAREYISAFTGLGRRKAP